MKKSKKIINELETKGYRVKWNNWCWKVYKYSEEQKAYLFDGYCATVEELGEI